MISMFVGFFFLFCMKFDKATELPICTLVSHFTKHVFLNYFCLHFILFVLDGLCYCFKTIPRDFSPNAISLITVCVWDGRACDIGYVIIFLSVIHSLNDIYVYRNWQYWNRLALFRMYLNWTLLLSSFILCVLFDFVCSGYNLTEVWI